MRLITSFSLFPGKPCSGIFSKRHWRMDPAIRIIPWRRNAQNYPGNKIPQPRTRFQKFQTYGPPIHLMNQRPTHRLIDILGLDEWPQSSFTLEAWMINHVNMPIGMLISARDKTLENPTFMLGYYDPGYCLPGTNK